MVDQNTQQAIKKRFAELPLPVRRAITSVDVQKKLREAADKHKLHLDQWEILENEVLMTLFGITPIDELQASIQKEVGVSAEIAAALSADISRIVFEPIRQELERELAHPEAKAKEMSEVEQVRQQALGDKQQAQETSVERRASSAEAMAAGVERRASSADTKDSTPLSAQLAARGSVIPATPPPPPPTEKAVRAPASGAYKPGEASSQRRDVADDPYREAPQ